MSVEATACLVWLIIERSPDKRRWPSILDLMPIHQFDLSREREAELLAVFVVDTTDTARVLRFPGRPSLADFDVLGQKLQEDADPDRQEPTLPKIDGMQFVDVAGVELFKYGN